jgi:3-phosphoshikimate 1-carboxyvinyltransferase
MQKIYPSKVKGRVVAPPSKSQGIRAIFAALLASGESSIEIPSLCDDVKAAMRCAEALGASIQGDNSRIRVHGPRKLKPNLNFRPLSEDGYLEIDCGESALCLRMATAICALSASKIRLNARGTLVQRNTPMIDKVLSNFGVQLQSDAGLPPFNISGRLEASNALINAAQTSQLLSGLLFALPLTSQNSEIDVINLTSKPYLEMSLEILAHFGISISASADLSHFKIPGNQSYKASSIKIEGDWSAAAPLLVAGALSGPIEIVGLNHQSKQADRAILSVLEQVGAKIKADSSSIIVERGDTKPFKFNAADCPDIVPALCALAVSLDQESIILGAQRLMNKESNRAQVLVEEFSKLGAQISLNADELRVTPAKLKGAEVDAHSDHRIAMTLAVAGLSASSELSISASSSVSKSYPNFFRDLQRISVK